MLDIASSIIWHYSPCTAKGQQGQIPEYELGIFPKKVSNFDTVDISILYCLVNLSLYLVCLMECWTTCIIHHSGIKSMKSKVKLSIISR